jgi:hypothetical protein
LIAENQRLAQENAQLWRWLEEAIEFPGIKQHEFVAIAPGMGSSLNQVLALSALIPARQTCPSRSTLHRRIKWQWSFNPGSPALLMIQERRCDIVPRVSFPDFALFGGISCSCSSCCTPLPAAGWSGPTSTA